MADLLKVTTPLINKNQPVQPRPGVDPTASFDLPQTSRIYQAQNRGELLKQNNSMFREGDAPALLLNLLKDPSVTVSYLKNITLLEEIFKLVPANNQAFTQEIEQAFENLLMQGDDIAAEIQRQGSDSTIFHGEIFDFLRDLVNENPQQPETLTAVAGMLKAMNNLLRKDDIIDAVRNSLRFIRDSVSSSQRLTAQMDDLLERFSREDAGRNFPELKRETLDLFKQLEESVLFSPKIAKNISISVYNLSRYNDSYETFQESAFYLRQRLGLSQRQRFARLSDDFIRSLSSRPSTGADKSKVMDALIKILGQQSKQELDGAAEMGRTEKIIHSLLSSPCNFTPLLHFVIPVMNQDMKAFAEIWVNPDSDEKDMPEGAGRGRHLLLVIDVEAVGRFEAELFVHGKTIDFSLFCPPGYEGPYEQMMKGTPRLMAELGYRPGELRLETLEHSRSLMEVFKSLPYRRVGMDVKV